MPATYPLVWNITSPILLIKIWANIRFYWQLGDWVPGRPLLLSPVKESFQLNQTCRGIIITFTYHIFGRASIFWIYDVTHEVTAVLTGNNWVIGINLFSEFQSYTSNTCNTSTSNTSNAIIYVHNTINTINTRNTSNASKTGNASNSSNRSNMSNTSNTRNASSARKTSNTRYKGDTSKTSNTSNASNASRASATVSRLSSYFFYRNSDFVLSKEFCLQPPSRAIKPIG